MNPLFNALFSPQSLAVVGASRSPSKIGYQLTKNLIKDGYKGNLYLVNPNAKEIMGYRVYPSLTKLPRVPQLVILVTPAPLVPPLIEEAGLLGVKMAIVISAGFAEGGQSGDALQEQLLLSQKKSRIRILGPNCLGVLNPYSHLNASFGPNLPVAGNIMLISQSGALVTGILDWLNAHQLGLSNAVTLGNRLDFGENDALEYAQNDRHTKIILIYLESFQHAPTFFAKASKLTLTKPIILLKGGSTQAGQAASASHTAALATNQVLVEAFARQTGVLIVPDMETWLSTATFLASAPKMTGNRIGIVTNAGGPGVLTADILSRLGLQLASFNRSTINRLKTLLPLSTPQNPLDILGDASPDRYHTALNLIKHDPGVDALITLMTPQTATLPELSAKTISSLIKSYPKPAVAVAIGGTKIGYARKEFKKNHQPVFDFPDDAVKVLSAKYRFHSQSQGIETFPSKTSISRKAIYPVMTAADLTLKASLDLLSQAGFKLPRSVIISSPSQISEALKETGLPAVVKTAAPRIPHKAKVGGVILDVMTGSAARQAFHKMQSLYPQVLFQQTISGRLELILGAKNDTQLGTFVMAGLGGTLTNALSDRAYAFIPTSKRYLLHSFETTKAYQAVKESGLSTTPIIEALSLLSDIMLRNPHISELEINPAILTSKFLYAADIKITLVNN